ncbi:MAG: ribosome silencing factor [Oscillospiraceae bacterium]|nr:ribosome silencing factor [Oscillospiraceae bacterium]
MKGLELSKKIAGYLDTKKAKDIRIIKIEDLTVVTDYIVIATGTSTTQVKALADEVDFMVDKKLGIKPARVEGYESKNWILLDYETVIVHVFHPQAREYYNLDKLWADGTEIEFELETEE